MLAVVITITDAARDSMLVGMFSLFLEPCSACLALLRDGDGEMHF